MAGYAANVPVIVETENTDNKSVFVGLFVDDEKVAEVAVAHNNKATIKAPVIQGETSFIAAWFEDGDPDMTTVQYIPVKHPPSNIWAPEVICVTDGYINILFGDHISLAKGATVKIDDAYIPPAKFYVEGKRLIIEAEATSGHEIIIKGIKYYELFPSYSFTFTLAF